MRFNHGPRPVPALALRGLPCSALLCAVVGGLVVLPGCEGLLSVQDTAAEVEADTPSGLGGIDGGADGQGDGASGEPVEHCGDLRADETWGPEGSLHRITCDMDVLQGTLTIMAGVAVEVDPGVILRVGDDEAAARLLIDGRPEAPVRMGPAEGDPRRGVWDGLKLGPRSAGSALRHLVLAQAGRSHGALWIDDSAPLVDGVQVVGAERCALEINGEGGFAEGSAGLVLRESGLPACLPLDAVASLPVDGSRYDGNDLDRIALLGERLSRSATWPDLGVPYAPAEHLKLEGSALEAVVLTLEAGVEVQLARGKAIQVSPGGGAAGLVALGSAAAPVVLSGQAASAAGSWAGLSVRPGASVGGVVLQDVIIRAAGQGGEGALDIDGAEVHLERLRIEDCAGPGLWLRDAGRLDEDSLQLSVVRCEVPVRLAPAAVGDLLPLELVAEDNARQWIEVDGDDALVRSARWLDLGLPYALLTSVKVDGTADAPAVLTLGTGATLLFQNGKGLYLGERGGAAGLLAEGTRERPVRFLPLSAEEPGAWSGISFQAATLEGSALRHFEVAFAGGPGVTGAVEVRDTDAPLIEDGLIRGTRSDECGLQLINSGVEPARLSFADNAGGDLCRR